MGEQMEKKFTWVLKKFSFVQDERCYSRPFTVAGCNWHLLAYRKGDMNDGHLALHLELANPESLPLGWRREVKLSLTLVTKGWGKSNLVAGGKCCFDATHKCWGYNKFVSLTKLHSKNEGFLVNNKLIMVAELHVFSPVVVQEETVTIVNPLSSKEGHQADYVSVSKSQGDSSCQSENADDNDTSKEGLVVDDDDTSEEGSCEDEVLNDDASSSVSDDGGKDISLSNQSNALEDASQTVGSHGIAKTETSNDDHDDAPKEDVDDDDDDDDSSLVSKDESRDLSSLNQMKSLEDTSQIVENGGKGSNNIVYVNETTDKKLQDIEPVKQTLDINGFEVHSSQVESVSHIFKRHPDIALSFCPKNQQIKRAYMDALLSLIKTLCKSPEKLSEDDLSHADDTLADLVDAGFKLDWLKTKLNQVFEKKKKEQSSGARLQTMEEQLQKLKLMFLDLETQLQKEKVEALAAKAPFSFDDIVF